MEAFRDEQGRQPQAPSQSRVRKWLSVLQGMADGTLSIGSRTPVANTPSWVTLEVAHGGFATGEYLAAGPLTDFEHGKLAQLGRDQSVSPRGALNEYYLSERGFSELLSLLQSGCYRVSVPEQAALLVIALLVIHDQITAAQELLTTIKPWFNQLRFYPEPTANPTPLAATVHLETVAEVTERLRGIEEHDRILQQLEALNIWLPLHDRFVRLVIDSCGESTQDSGDQFGIPFSRCDDRWYRTAAELLLQYSELRRVHQRCGKPERRGEIFYELRRLVRKRLDLAPNAPLPDNDIKRTTEMLRRDVAKRGAIDSADRRMLRQTQQRDGLRPTHASAAKVIANRLTQFEPDHGLEHPESVLQPELNQLEQHQLFGKTLETVPAFEFPESVGRKVKRCLEASVDELVAKGLITSGDVLARLVPQISGRAMSWRFADETVRRLYLQTYRAFRARRSLLLLNLQKQVQFEELPWVTKLQLVQAPSYDRHISPRRTLVDVTILNLMAFPHAIVPNKLLQELRALAEAAAIPLELLDELAADIFMGKFSRKFGNVARQTAQQLQGTLYARYYAIDTDELLRMRFEHRQVAEGLAELCARRAGVTLGGWRPATNGCIIEQAQILTTQNLATLFAVPGVREQLAPHLSAMANQTMRWLLDELAKQRSDRHARLIAIKNAAYAWRQMVFYLSQLEDAQARTFIDACPTFINKYRPEFQARIAPVIQGLRNAVEGHDTCLFGGQQFVGWSETTHWLLEAEHK